MTGKMFDKTVKTQDMAQTDLATIIMARRRRRRHATEHTSTKHTIPSSFHKKQKDNKNPYQKQLTR